MSHTVEEDWQVGDQVEVWDGAEGGDPSDEELAREGVRDVDPLAEQRHEGGQVERLRLGDDVLHQPVEQLHAGLHLSVRVGRQLEKTVENLVEVGHARGACHLCDVVQRLAAVVAHARIRIAEGGEHRLQ